MTRFVEDALKRAGLFSILEARRSGDFATVRAAAKQLETADLLLVGAAADAIRSEDVGETVHVHAASDAYVKWVSTNGSELDLLRALAIARVMSDKGERIGVDWGRYGLELAQVALGFGASDLVGPITRKSGLPIYEDEAKKVKGQGMVALASLKKQEIALLVKHAGRLAVFVDDDARTVRDGQEVLGV